MNYVFNQAIINQDINEALEIGNYIDFVKLRFKLKNIMLNVMYMKRRLFYYKRF